MTIDRMIELLKTEHECMLRNSHGSCNRECADCDLVQDDSELHEMYSDVIAMLEAQRIPKDESITNAIECLLHPDDNYEIDVSAAIELAIGALSALKIREPETVRYINTYRPGMKQGTALNAVPSSMTLSIYIIAAFAERR